MSLPLLILGLILFVGLVIVHELGHYLVARRNGVVAEEFGIFFPPKVWGKKLKNGTLFTINLLPLGGFVKLKGEHDADKGKGTYGAASLKAKTKIMTAGVGMNLLTAYIVLLVLALVGMPRVIDNQFTVKSDTKTSNTQVLVGYVEPDSPAAKAGLKEGDRLLTFHPTDEVSCLSLDCTTGEAILVENQESLPDVTKQLEGQTVVIEYSRSGDVQTAQAALRTTQEVEASKSTDKPKGYLGVSPSEYALQHSTWSAPVVAAGLLVQMTELTFKGLGHVVSSLVSGHASQAGQQVAGPVGIFVLLKDGSMLGFQFILFIIAIISLTLAIMNILPIPALDGGRLFLTWFYRLIHRPLTKRAEELINGTGFVLLMLLFVLITIVDVRRFF